MTPRRAALIVAFTVVAALLGWLMFVGLPRWYGAAPKSTAAAAPPTSPAEAARKIKARLFYVSQDGTRLSSVERDVPYAEQTADQAREIMNAQIAPVAEPLVSAIPAATKLRALYVTNSGEAFVDLSGEVVSAHPGGSMSEILTVYTVVHALTVNLPAVSTVQVLVDGKEVETLAGHVDLRRPLAKNGAWLEDGAAHGEPAPPNSEPVTRTP